MTCKSCEHTDVTIDRLRARIARLERACEVFVTWLDREEAGFANVGARGTPAGEADWREWYDENLRLCSLAQSLARDAIEKATKL